MRDNHYFILDCETKKNISQIMFGFFMVIHLSLCNAANISF